MKGYGYEDYVEEENQPNSPELESDENSEDQDLEDTRRIIHPQPEQFKTPGQRFNEKYDDIKYENLPFVDLRKDFGRLQIIVKLASIHLTPAKPAYDGGSWHVEGQLNEAMLVSSALEENFHSNCNQM